jgi:hypothetical protein
MSRASPSLLGVLLFALASIGGHSWRQCGRCLHFTQDVVVMVIY